MVSRLTFLEQFRELFHPYAYANLTPEEKLLITKVVLFSSACVVTHEDKALPITESDLLHHMKHVTSLSAFERQQVIDSDEKRLLEDDVIISSRLHPLFIEDYFEYYFQDKWEDLVLSFEVIAEFLGLDLDELLSFDPAYLIYIYYAYLDYFYENLSTILDAEGVSKEIQALVAKGDLILDLDNDDSAGLSRFDYQAFLPSSANNWAYVTDSDVNISVILPLELMRKAYIQILNYQPGFNERLVVDVKGTNIKANFNSETGFLRLLGKDTQAMYEEVIASIYYTRHGASGMYARDFSLKVIDSYGHSLEAQSYLTFVAPYFDLASIESNSPDGRLIKSYIDGALFGYNVALVGAYNEPGRTSEFLITSPMLSNAEYGLEAYYFYGADITDNTEIMDDSMALNTTFSYRLDAFKQLVYIGTLGDINGDGVDDNAVSHTQNANDLGEVLVDMGTSTIRFVASRANGFGVLSNRAGDMNGDGLDDLLVASKFDNQLYVKLGHSGVWTDDFDMVFNLSSKQYKATEHVSFVGDFNADGFDDVLIGGHHEFKMILGQGHISQSWTQHAISWEIDASLHLSALSGIGDFNGDGFDDFALGLNGGVHHAGEIHIVYGSDDLSQFKQATIYGLDGFNQAFGYSLSQAGDFNGDGLDDLIIGDPWYQAGGTDAETGSGRAYVLYGTKTDLSTFSSLNINELISENLTGHGFYVDGKQHGDALGFAVSGGYNVEGDDYDDVLIGAPGVDNGRGEAYLIYGMPSAYAEGITDVANASHLNLIGTHADDSLYANGMTQVVMRAGAGDDKLYGNAHFQKLDGGQGFDRFVLEDGDIDFSRIANNRISSIEEIQLDDDQSANQITLSLSDIFDMTDHNNTLRLLGQSHDKVVLLGGEDFVQVKTYEDLDLSRHFDVYTNGHAVLEIEKYMQIDSV